jgi:hypothetical protein
VRKVAQADVGDLAEGIAFSPAALREWRAAAP